MVGELPAEDEAADLAIGDSSGGGGIVGVHKGGRHGSMVSAQGVATPQAYPLAIPCFHPIALFPTPTRTLAPMCDETDVTGIEGVGVSAVSREGAVVRLELLLGEES